MVPTRQKGYSLGHVKWKVFEDKKEVCPQVGTQIAEMWVIVWDTF